jgi:hypothetical protein
MDWSSERYVRVYTRDTADWLALGWEAQALFVLLLRKMDRVGSLDLGRHGARGLAALLRVPLEVVERALPLLLADGCIEQHETVLVCRNFIEAQEASMSAAARQKESRLRRRDQLRLGIDPARRETVVYFVQSEHGGEVKIGHAEDLASRLVQLQVGRPDRVVVIGSVVGTVGDERALHEQLGSDRIKGEWFAPSPRVMAVAKAAGRPGATVADVFEALRDVTGHELFGVTSRDTNPPVSPGLVSQDVTSHSVPYRAVPCLPDTGSLSDPSAADSCRDLDQQQIVRLRPDGLALRVEPLKRPELQSAPPLLTLVEPGKPKKQAKPKSKHPERVQREAAEWLAWYHEKFQRTRFELRDELVKQVGALLAKGFTPRDLRMVALFKKAQWENDPRMCDRLVPVTLLRAESFGSYLDQARAAFEDGAPAGGNHGR